jgi:hypothetical protein
MNKNRKTALVLLGIFVFCGGSCYVGWTIFWRTIMREYAFMSGGEPAVILHSDGDRMYVSYSPSKKEHDVVPGRGSGISVDLYIIPEHETDNILTITDGKNKVVKRDIYLRSPLWSAKHQAAYFLRSHGAGGGNPGNEEIWTWTHAHGSELWHTVLDKREATIDPPKMTESLDGKWFCFGAAVGNGNYRRYIYLVSLEDKQETWFVTDMENGKDDGHFWMVDDNTFFKAGNYASGTRTKIFEKRTGKSMESPIQGELEQFVEFHGEPWALRCKDGIYDVVKVSRNLDQVKEAIPIPSNASAIPSIVGSNEPVP